MSVGENEFQSTGDPALDIIMESNLTEGSNEPELQSFANEAQQEVTGETPTNDNPELYADEQIDVPTLNQETDQEPTNAPEGFDQNNFIGEMSGGMFDSVEAFQEADVFNKLQEFDQLYDELESFRNSPEPEPTYANSFTKELDEYVRGGGDAKTFFEIVKADYDEVSDIDLMTRDLMSKQGLTADEASKFINYRYKQDQEEFTESEAEMGSLNMKMDANKVREEFKSIQEQARVPQGENDVQDFEASEDARMNDWDGVISDTIDHIADPTVSLGKELGDFTYQLSDDDLDSVDDFVYDAIEGFGLDINDTDPAIVQQMANNHIWATKGPEIMQAALSDQFSRLEEKYFKDRHNPAPIPGTDTPGTTTGEMSRDEAIFNTIMGGEGLM